MKHKWKTKWKFNYSKRNHRNLSLQYSQREYMKKYKFDFIKIKKKSLLTKKQYKESKKARHTMRKYSKYMYLTKDWHPEYISDITNKKTNNLIKKKQRI